MVWIFKISLCASKHFNVMDASNMKMQCLQTIPFELNFESICDQFHFHYLRHQISGKTKGKKQTCAEIIGSHKRFSFAVG